MPEKQADALIKITEMLEKLNEPKKTKYWPVWAARLGMGIVVILFNAGLWFGIFQTTLDTHINNADIHVCAETTQQLTEGFNTLDHHIGNQAIHITEKQKTSLTLNTQHRNEFSHQNFNSTYTTLFEHSALVFRVEKLEEKEEGNKR